MNWTRLRGHAPIIDAWLFAFLVGGYAIFAALHFTDTLASLVVLLLALCAIGLYLSRVNYRRRLYLVYAAIAAIVAGHSRVWLVVALDHNEEYQMSRVREFDAKDTRIDSLNVGGIRS